MNPFPQLFFDKSSKCHFDCIHKPFFYCCIEPDVIWLQDTVTNDSPCVINLPSFFFCRLDFMSSSMDNLYKFSFKCTKHVGMVYSYTVKLTEKPEENTIEIKIKNKNRN